MDKIADLAKSEIEALQKTPITQDHLVTANIREVSGRLFHALEDKSIGTVLNLCGELLEEHSWPLGVIAYDWAYRVRKQYNTETFQVFESWLIKYVRGWGDCDDFCTHAFGELLCQKIDLFEQIKKWVSREEFWMRRAAAVILIPLIRSGRYLEIQPFDISEALLQDGHDLVLKGYGWMLKVLSQKDPELVFEYLQQKQEIMPRVAFRYALEKLDKEKKAILMGKN